MTLRRQAADALCAAIRLGEFKVGDRLPSAEKLAPRFGVSRSSMFLTLKELERRGIVRIEHGSGSWVTRMPDRVPTIDVRAELKEVRDRITMILEALG